MRVLLTTDTVGGVWTFTKELTRELLHLGHAVALVSFGRLPSPEQLAWCSATWSSNPATFRYEASAAPLEWMEANDISYTSAEPLLLRVATEFSADVLHSSQFCFGRLPVGIPKIVTAHSDVLSWSEACTSGGIESSAWLTRYCQLVQEGLQGADAVAAPTQWMLAALGRNFSLPRAQHVILNGRTLPGLLARPRKLQAVSAGRLWDEAKNLSMLTRLDSPLPIVVAGEQQLNASSEAGDLQSVHALGALDEDTLVKLFCSSSIYIAASIYEPFGLAPLEAALCGCAVVANDISSLREVWGDAALYFNDGASLVALLNEFMSSPALLRAARACSLQRAGELTSVRMAEEYIGVYKNLLHTPPVPPLISPPYQELAAHVS